MNRYKINKLILKHQSIVNTKIVHSTYMKKENYKMTIKVS